MHKVCFFILLHHYLTNNRANYPAPIDGSESCQGTGTWHGDASVVHRCNIGDASLVHRSSIAQASLKHR